MKGERILFEIAHPKHYHQFKGLMTELRKENEIQVIARDRDVVLDLLKADNIEFTTYGLHGKSLTQKILYTLKILKDYIKVVSSFRPTLIISKSSPYAAVVGKLKGVKTCIMNDSEIVGLTNKFVFPLTSLMITPMTFPQRNDSKHFRVDGLFEESYLHPLVFQPDEGVLNQLGVEKGEAFALLRFVGWNANHDVGNKGFKPENQAELTDYLSQKMKVFVSCEDALPKHLVQFTLPTSPDRIHHVLSFAALYIGDSQTMATEAALLGTPAIRFNSFVGEHDMNNFKYLQSEGLLSNELDFKGVLERAGSFSESGTKAKWQAKRAKYFEKKDFVNSQIRSVLFDWMSSKS